MPQRPNSGWAKAWIAWLGLFLLVELPAALKKSGGTLSETVWRWFSIREHRPHWKLRRAIFWVFWLGLSLHLGLRFGVGIDVLWFVVIPAIPFCGVIGYSVWLEPKE